MVVLCRLVIGGMVSYKSGASYIISVLVFAALAGAAGCGGQDAPLDSTATPILSEAAPVLTPAITFTPEQAQPSPTVTPTPEATATLPASPTPASDDEATTGGEIGEIWSLADIRYSANESRHRIVWEMAEQRAEVPRYQIRRVDTDSGSRLEVVLIDVYAYEYPLNDVLPIEPADGTVTRIEGLSTFDDASLGFAIELTAPADYEAFELTEPVRIVLDVAR